MTEMMISTVDGEVLEAATWPDGSWECPFCKSPNRPAEERPWPYPCGNPMCIAGGRGDAASVAAIRLERQRQAEGETRRAWLAKSAEEAAAKREQDRKAACEAFGAEAQEEGFCWTCWAKSTSWGLYLGSPRKVRHRSPANCPGKPGRRRATAG